ncbi:MAG: CesT family type III secretion system chaperone [Verrucomicrobia bacterium]|nr:CesT family type III secretion system chaperone [Verrucomicrobiota bacterium]MBS0636866.1 CesT family type III secretion system chaperone [Verrucomicrobiota bacterium]
MSLQAAQKVQEWLTTAGRILGVEAHLSKDGSCSLLLNNNLIITVQVPQEGDRFFLFTPLGELPKDNGFAVCQRALELNAFQGATRGGSIGLVPDEPLLVYTTTHQVEGCDEQIFADTVAFFYETALDLKGTLEL